MEAAISWLVEKITALFEFLRDQAWLAIDWVFEQFRGIFWWVFGTVGEFVLWLIEGIPVPGWFDGATLQDLLAGIPAEVWWGIEFAQLPTGLAMVFGAYGIRFAVRRLPLVG